MLFICFSFISIWTGPHNNMSNLMFLYLAGIQPVLSCIAVYCAGRDAKRLVILKGDFESGEEKGGYMKEDIAKKYSAYFQSILHHNNGYFITVGDPNPSW